MKNKMKMLNKNLNQSVKSEKENKNKSLFFNQWLAGLIDGNGQFTLAKNGYSSCTITMKANDIKVLNIIKNKFGGNIKPIASSNSIRYKLRHKKGLILLINSVKGELRNPSKFWQMSKLCKKYELEFYEVGSLTFNNGWFSGLLDSNGSIYYDKKSQQISIRISSKNSYMLELLREQYGGKVKLLHSKEGYQYIIYRKKELIELVNSYFTKFPLNSKKEKRILLIKEFYNVIIYKDSIENYNKWINFKEKWDKCLD